MTSGECVGMMGGEKHDDFESRAGGVEHYAYSCMGGDPQEIRRHGDGMIRCRK